MPLGKVAARAPPIALETPWAVSHPALRTWSPGVSEEARTRSPCWAHPAWVDKLEGDPPWTGRWQLPVEWGEEIFLEVAGKQAFWHTPSWRVLRSNAGQGGAQLGEPRELVVAGSK